MCYFQKWKKILELSERDVLEKAGEILKKEEGVSLAALTNREKKNKNY